MRKTFSNIFLILFLTGVSLAFVSIAHAQANYNPNLILSDNEMFDYQSWNSGDVQRFLDSKGSYLRHYQAPDFNGVPKTAADIIYEAAQNHHVSAKFLLVTLQKEQSLITDDAPAAKQLDWATGFAVCDNCSRDDQSVAKYKGFGKQVDGAAGIIEWYNLNKETGKSSIKKKDTPIRIDKEDVTPQNWATAFLYTYTPHRHGNLNFWRIWNTWFEQVYPNGTLFKAASSSEYWLVKDNLRQRFKNQTALISRTDPKLAIVIPDIELERYHLGPDISYPNYSILRSTSSTYLLDYDTLRPFASDEVVRVLGYNPQEIVDVSEADLVGLTRGSSITASSTSPVGAVFQITNLDNVYYLLKDNVLFPIIDKLVVDTNFKHLPLERHTTKDLRGYTIADSLITFSDGTLLQAPLDDRVYVVDKGKKRQVADDETFKQLGYKRTNIVTVSFNTLLLLPQGERLFVNSSLLSSKNKFLGDNVTTVNDEFDSSLPSYLVAEYPSGRILSGKKIDTPHPIASLTKLLTAFEALNNNYKPNKTTTYSEKKFAAEGSKSIFKNGERIKNEAALMSMLVASNNNSARMVAQGTGDSEDTVVQNMNNRLAAWGADDTMLADVTGLSENNKSTARDLLKIFTRVLDNETIKKALGQKNYRLTKTVGKHTVVTVPLKNTNQLFFTAHPHYTILASKTGYTNEAGGIIAMLVQGKKDKKKYVVITMANDDAEHRFLEPGRIAEWIVMNRNKLTLKG